MTRLCTAAVALLLSTFAAAADNDSPFNDLGPHSTYKVTPFSLTERSGRTVTLEDLRGKVWVANFFFTCCSRACGPMNANLAELHRSLADRNDIMFVSFSVLPEYDTPERLQEYAKALGADPERWLFLTGPENEIYQLTRTAFMQPLIKNEEVKTRQFAVNAIGTLAAPGGASFYAALAAGSFTTDVDQALAVEHTSYLTVIDRDGRIRGILTEGARPDKVKYLEGVLRDIAGARSVFPAINASLNALCTVLLILGWLEIRSRHETRHKVLMLAALAVSAVFLASYLYYHIVIAHGQPTRFQREGAVKIVYFAVLLSHTVLAVVAAPLALYTAFTGLRDRRPRHVWLARWTLPIWLYVSVTGVVVYWMLYQL